MVEPNTDALATPCASAERATFRPFIYGLVDPLDAKHVRYVGMAMQPRRPYQHALNAKKSAKHSHLFHWIRVLLAEGREPSVLVLEELHEDSSRSFVGAIERMYISSLRGIGHRLTNVAEGGFGGSTRTGLHNTEHQKVAVRAAHLGRAKSSEHCASVSAAKKGVPGPKHSEETRKKIGESNRNSLAFREAMKSETRSAAISAGQLGRKHSAEEVAAACKTRAQTIAKRREENDGRYRTVESCRKAGESIQAALARRTPEQRQAQVAKRRATLQAKGRTR